MNASLFPNLMADRWQTGTGAGIPLLDPVLGTDLARVASTGIDLAEAFADDRETGGPALFL
jgi:3,4-dehydroadipyl-CoA semialdehyde dehydrogenase